MSALIFLAFLILTLLKFHRGLFTLSTAFLAGPFTDFAHNHWVIAWDLHKFTTGLSGYWTPPLFTPLNNTLGFCDHMPGSSLTALPIYLLFGNTVLCYNFIFLISFILSGFFTYLLAKEVTGHTLGAALAGYLLAFGQARWGQYDHLHMLSYQWLILALYLGVRYQKFQHPRDMVMSFLTLSLQCISGLSLGLMSFYTLLGFWGYLYFSSEKFQTKSFLTKVLVGQLISGLCFVWAAWPNYLIRQSEGASWSWGDIELGSSALGNFLLMSRLSCFFPSCMNAFHRGVDELCYFPGFLLYPCLYLQLCPLAVLRVHQLLYCLFLVCR